MAGKHPRLGRKHESMQNMKQHGHMEKGKYYENFSNRILFPQICSKMCCGHNVDIYNMRNSCELGKGRLADGSTS